MSKKLPAYVKETFGSLPTTCSVCCVASLSTSLCQSLSAYVKAKSLPADVQETFESLPAYVKQTLPCQKETTESHNTVIYSLTETLPLTHATQSQQSLTVQSLYSLYMSHRGHIKSHDTVAI